MANYLRGADHVVAFGSERNSVLCRKDAGEPFPWMFDPILSYAGSFTNVRREDDRTTRAYPQLIRSR
jgi:hypothetical protein